MRKLLIFAVLGACGGSSSDQEATPAPDTAQPAAPAVQADTQTMPQPDVIIATDTRSYRAGDPVELRITNSSARRFTFNPCTRALEREDDGVPGQWTEVNEHRMCTMIAHLLEPNATRNEKTELGEELGPGRYRMLIRFVDDAPPKSTKGAKAAKPASASTVTAYTAPFTVTSTR